MPRLPGCWRGDGRLAVGGLVFGALVVVFMACRWRERLVLALWAESPAWRLPSRGAGRWGALTRRTLSFRSVGWSWTILRRSTGRRAGGRTPRCRLRSTWSTRSAGTRRRSRRHPRLLPCRSRRMTMFSTRTRNRRPKCGRRGRWASWRSGRWRVSAFSGTSCSSRRRQRSSRRCRTGSLRKSLSSG